MRWIRSLSNSACCGALLRSTLTGVLVVVPFELSFLELSARVRRDLLRFDLCVDCMFAVDIVLKCVVAPRVACSFRVVCCCSRSVLTLAVSLSLAIPVSFNTAIERDGKLHFSFRSIYRQYLRGWFAFDVACTFPFYALVNRSALSASLPAQAAEHSELYNLFRVLRLLRVAELPRVRRRLEYSLLISSKVGRLGSFLFLVLALSHVFR